MCPVPPRVSLALPRGHVFREANTLHHSQRTARYLVGNGSKPAPTLIHETLWDLMRHKTAAQISGKVRPGLPKDPEDANRTSNQRVLHALAQPLQPLRFLFYPDVLTTLLANALPYTAREWIATRFFSASES